MLIAKIYRYIERQNAITSHVSLLAVILLVLVNSTFVFGQVQNSDVSQLNEREERGRLVAANKILSRSEGLFKKGEYWSCAQELIIILDFFPQFDKMDKVVNLLGQCLFQEELTEASIRMFNYLLKNYKTSDYVGEALLGLERGFYQQHNYKQALRVFYVILKNSQYYATVFDEACYLAGKCHYELKNYDIAISTLKKINNKSEFYDSALYATALSYLKISDVATAVDDFRKIISLPIINGERLNIVDNARLTLGLIYFELNAFDASIHQLSKISPNHEHYQDALLGLGWAYLKKEDYENVIKILNKLVKEFPNTANAEESYFLLGQAYLALGNYDESLRAYRTIVDFYPERQNMPGLLNKVHASLQEQQNRIEELKEKILIEESKLLDAMPMISPNKEIPEYLIDKKNELSEVREKMIAHLLNERDHLLILKQNTKDMAELLERQERRKDWRAYAEYGISRSLFLKEMSTAQGN